MNGFWGEVSHYRVMNLEIKQPNLYDVGFDFEAYWQA
jgi:hypothetical protein